MHYVYCFVSSEKLVTPIHVASSMSGDSSTNFNSPGHSSTVSLGNRNNGSYLFLTLYVLDIIRNDWVMVSTSYIDETLLG